MSEEAKKIEILSDILGSYYRSGSEILFICKFCGHHKPKLSINLEKNKMKCWVCDRAGPISRIIKRFGNFTQQKQWNTFDGIVEIANYDLIFSQEEEVEVKQEKIILPEDFRTLCTKKQDIFSYSAKRYLSDREITKEDILFWKIGYAEHGEYEKRVIVPSFDASGALNYYVGRRYDGKTWQKYKNPEASKDIIFNELSIDWTSDVTIVEGVFDAIKAKNAIPLLGSTMRENSKLFKEIIKNDPKVYIALDPDAEKKAEKLMKDLLLFDAEVYKIDIPKGKDVGDMTKEEFLDRKRSAKLVKETDYFLMNEIMRI